MLSGQFGIVLNKKITTLTHSSTFSTWLTIAVITGIHTSGDGDSA